MPLSRFHPAVATWFAERFGEPTEPQARAWPAIQSGRHALIAAPTGSGKTLAAFLSAIDDLVRRGLAGELGDETRVVYVSPLKALSNDIQRNLEEPLAGIRAQLEMMGLPAPGIRTLVRTGDTPAAERAAMVKKPPHILVTTPESLFILLTSESGRRLLRTVRTAIVDEIHAVAGNKRGSHLALSLERLAELVERDGGRLLRIGLSATQKPIEAVARFLVGAPRPVVAGALAGGGSESKPEGARSAGEGSASPPRRDLQPQPPPPIDCTIVDAGHGRELDLGIEVPRSPLEAVMANEVWEEVYDRIAELVREHRTTLVFTNTRRLTERASRHLARRLGEDKVASHHGSLARDKRFDAEQRLKNGQLSCLVATASLELGIDIGSVDLVCQLGSPRSIAAFLQRVGRAGHRLGAVPKGRIFPSTRDELVEIAALLDAVRRGELDRLIIPEAPLDILAQHLVAMVAAEERQEDELFALVRRAWPFRDLAREDFDEVVEMLATGFATHRGRRAAYLHHDAVHGRLRPRKGARMTAITSGGAIPDTADYQVLLEPSATLVGTVHEDFAVESLAGDVFQLGNTSWRILKVEPGKVRVEDAHGQPPTIPFWLGEAPGRSNELSVGVSRLRIEVERRLSEGGQPAAVDWLTAELGFAPEVASQIAFYLAAAAAALGVLPSQETLVAERFFDEAGDQHMVVHSPFGSRMNRAWGLALRKRFCQTFNFELQAAATEDAIVLSLGPTHSFPLEDAFHFLHSNTVRGVLTQALLDAPLFGVRFRWNASRALAVPRFRGGRRVPAPLLRQQSEDLVAVVFPDQLACLENIVGEREIPDHPLIEQTLEDCLEEAMDLPALEGLLRRMEGGQVQMVARDLTEPSPLAYEILGAQPYAFLDDAPLEERRTQAVQRRRFLDPETAADLGALDAEAIARVRAEAWPEAESPDELHDALMTTGFLTAEEGNREGWEAHFAALAADSRATAVAVPGGPLLWLAAERLPEMRALHPTATWEPAIQPPARLAAREHTPEAARTEFFRGRLSSLGPVTAAELAASLGLRASGAESALAELEGEGFAMRGRFTPGAGETEWCDRRLLARIHRLTLDRLRREIEPVTAADFLRFLFAWQRVVPSPGEPAAEGPEALAAILAQLEGFEAPAAAWEGEILPARMPNYDPAWLDALCLAGRITWGRVSAPAANGPRRSGPVRATPLVLVPRVALPRWREVAPAPNLTEIELSADAQAALEHLTHRGASFFEEIGREARILPTRLESALAELVSWGLVTADSFTGLRALLVPTHKRPRLAGATHGRPTSSASSFSVENAGRWSLFGRGGTPNPPSAEAIEGAARVLLTRYGVVFRKLLEREGLALPWRDLVMVYRRLEARGEIRGGRFVEGFAGEQFALPEAVGKLRKLRREPRNGALLSVSAADPLNLVGILTPGNRIATLSGNRVLYRDGEPIAIYEGKKTQFLRDLPQPDRWQAENALVRRAVAPRLKAYLGGAA